MVRASGFELPNLLVADHPLDDYSRALKLLIPK